ncbi:MAG: LytR/AlgR family response regulator transcription factor [Acidobacteriota bacterium]
MKLRALVVEDEWVARNYLVELLQASGAAEVVAAVDHLDVAREALDSLALDVAFVDIELVGSDGDGLALVRERAARGSPLFVLATAHSQHALAAYELGVADYLLKPFTAARVEQCLARVGERTPRPAAASPPRIVARRKRALVFLRLEEVWAFQAAERLAYVHSPRGTFDVDLSLAAIEASFGRAFVRTHRNWLVNADHVLELEGTGSDTELVVGGLRVPVARERAASVRDRLLANTSGIRPR